MSVPAERIVRYCKTPTQRAEYALQRKLEQQKVDEALVSEASSRRRKALEENMTRVRWDQLVVTRTGEYTKEEHVGLFIGHERFNDLDFCLCLEDVTELLWMVRLPLLDPFIWKVQEEEAKRMRRSAFFIERKTM